MCQPEPAEVLEKFVDSGRKSMSTLLTEFEKDIIIRLSGSKVEKINKKTLLLISANG